jgi:hypothetical protein
MKAPPSRRVPWGVLLAALLALLAPAAPRALADEGDARNPAYDRVTLRNGNVFEGRIVTETESELVIALPSLSGGGGRITVPRAMVARVEHGTDRSPLPGSEDALRDAWYLLGSGGMPLGTRHLLLRQVRGTDGNGWLLQEETLLFARGPHIPPVRTTRSETVDLRFLPLRMLYREVGEGSRDPAGPRRYERIVTGRVENGTWQGMRDDGGGAERSSFALPAGVRGRLGTREHLLRRRGVGLEAVTYFDVEAGRLVEARAGYTALGARDATGPYDEFVWEEDGVRLVSRFRDAEVLVEAVAEGVVATPATREQAEAAAAEVGAAVESGEVGRVTLSEVGVSFKLPGTSWSLARAESVPGAEGWRKVANVESAYHVADVRIEWDPEGARLAPGPAEAEARLLQRLGSVCPDLRAVEPRAPLADVPGAWRILLRGTLRGETVYTIAVVLDRGASRVLFLAACPEASWREARPAIEALLASIRPL